LAYASSWLKCHHPDVFCAALLNAQPMGFYAPAQLVRDAREHGVEVRPVCINASRWDCTLEPTADEDRFAVRLGMRMVKGLANTHAATLIGARADRPFTSVDDLWRRAVVPAASLVSLAEADAPRPSLQLERRDALWALKGLQGVPLPLFTAASSPEAGGMIEEIVEPSIALRPLPAGGEVVEDYHRIGLSLRAHPLRFLREELAAEEMLTCASATALPDGKWASTAGMVLVRQRPGSSEGVVFITIEDETGIANLVVWPDVFETYRKVILSARMLGVFGRVQKEGEVVHIVARRLMDMSGLLASVGGKDDALLSGGHVSQEEVRVSYGVEHGQRDRHQIRKGNTTIKVRTRDFH
jgi:error-prone DNA polymerase